MIILVYPCLIRNLINSFRHQRSWVEMMKFCFLFIIPNNLTSSPHYGSSEAIEGLMSKDQNRHSSISSGWQTWELLCNFWWHLYSTLWLMYVQMASPNLGTVRFCFWFINLNPLTGFAVLRLSIEVIGLNKR